MSLGSAGEGVKRSYSSKAKRTALYPLHVESNGKMVEFGGYLLPVQYGTESISESHLNTRASAGLFDVSHMLQTHVYGKHREQFMESICTADVQGKFIYCRGIKYLRLKDILLLNHFGSS